MFYEKAIRSCIADYFVGFSFLIIPSPFSGAHSADGGTISYYPILPVFCVVDWNQINITDHNPNNPDADPSQKSYTVKGLQVFIFGISVYDGRYTVEGIHTRGS